MSLQLPSQWSSYCVQVHVLPFHTGTGHIAECSVTPTTSSSAVHVGWTWCSLVLEMVEDTSFPLMPQQPGQVNHRLHSIGNCCIRIRVHAVCLQLVYNIKVQMVCIYKHERLVYKQLTCEIHLFCKFCALHVFLVTLRYNSISPILVKETRQLPHKLYLIHVCYRHHYI